MSKYEMGWDIGEGLMSDEPVPVELEFPSCTAVFWFRPLTADLLVELEAEGLNLSDIREGRTALSLARTLLSRIVDRWEGLLDVKGREVLFTPENRDRLAAAPNLITDFWKIASDLGAKQRVIDEGNSDA